MRIFVGKKKGKGVIMKSLISRVKLQLSKFLSLIATGYCPGPGVKPEDWWRFHVDYMEY